MKPLLFILLLAAVPALGLPDVVSYAARVENDAGPFDGNVAVTFQLFDAEVAGTELWSESVSSTTVVGGDLVHELGSIEPLDDSVLEREDLFLAVTMNGDLLEPRVALRAVPYALKAQEAESLSGLSADDIATDAEVGAAIAEFVTDDELGAAVAAVSFAQLQAVPAGFADGVDDDTVAAAAVGGGLTLAGSAFSIADDGVTLARMADDSVGQAELIEDSVGTSELIIDAVARINMADDSVGTAELVNGAVTSAKIANDAVGAAAIAASAVTSSELADDAVTAAKISGTPVAIFSRPNACGGGLQVGSGNCNSIVCDEVKIANPVVTAVNFVAQTVTNANFVFAVDVVFFRCDGTCDPTNGSQDSCPVTVAAGSLLP